MEQAGGLLANSLHDAGMGMTQRIHAQAGDEIEILLAFCVVEEHTLAAFEGDRITVIGLEKVAALEVDNLFEVCHGKQDFTRVGCGRGNS